MYRQNPDLGWVEPPWRYDKIRLGIGTTQVKPIFPKTTALTMSGIDLVIAKMSTLSCVKYSSDIVLRFVQVPYPGVLLVCHQITDEVRAMLYGGNVFAVNIHGDGQLNLVRLFSSETREKMRKVILVLRPRGVSGFCMDPKIWDGILGNLSMLGVIAEEPQPLP
jgi:hypothetical protein